MTKSKGFPKEVVVLGERFTVKLGGKSPSDAEGEKIWGEMKGAAREICIYDHAIEQNEQVRCLAHEMVHAALYVSGLSAILETAEIEEEALAILFEGLVVQATPLWARLFKAFPGK